MSPSDDAPRSPWVAFAGLKFEYVAARPDDGYVHLGAGRPFRRLTLCDKRARRPWWGAGAVCPDCQRLAPPWLEILGDEVGRVRQAADRAAEVGDTAKAEGLRQLADDLEGRDDRLKR
jgi:hypothetical protein